MAEVSDVAGGAGKGAGTGAAFGPYGAVIGGVLGGIGGLFKKKDDREERARAAEELAIRQLQGIRMPTLEELKYMPEEYQYLGDLIAAQEEAGQLGPSQMAQIQLSPEYKQQQLLALQKLQERGEQGLTATERATLNEMRRQSEGAERSRQQAVLQSMAERGAGGSGAELAARLSSSQAEANRASAEGDRLAAMAQERALQAIVQGGALAGDVRRQEFGEQSDVARAADEIARFNLSNLQNVRGRNIDREQATRERNIGAKQRIGEQNVEGRNIAQTTNINQQIADYNRRYGAAEDVSNIYQNRAKAIRGQAADTTPNMAERLGGFTKEIMPSLGELYGKYKKNDMDPYEQYGRNLKNR